MSAVHYLEVPIDELRANPFNSNKVTPENERKIRESIKRNGIFKPIVVRQIASVSGYQIIGGQHRWEQAKELGFTAIPIANLGEIDDKRAKEIGLLDNARYGSDDAMQLSDILKDIGDLSEIQSFLPYGEADLDALFSATTIDLDSLEMPPADLSDPTVPVVEEKPAKVAKTHTVMRFKLSLGDAERITQLIAKTQREQGFTAEDDLTNAGDALTFLLTSGTTIADAPATAAESWSDMLDEIEAAQKEAEDE